MEHDLTFQQIKERVDLPEMLAHYGYQLRKGENLSKGKWHVFEGDDTLVVFKGRGNDWMYFNAQDDRDKGSVVDWMRNRVSTGRIAGIEQKPGRNLWQSVNDHFREYLNLPESARPKLSLEPISPMASSDKFTNSYTQNCRPLEDTTYLESRGITKTTLANPQFAGRILNQVHTVQKEGMPAITYVNTAFPARYEDRVVALELKGPGYKGQAADSEFSRSLWLSKKPEGKPATHLVVSESAIDTLSYAQLNPNDRAIYASTAGNLTQNKIFEMKRIMATENLPAIRSLFDNDTQGHHFDTRLLAGFASERNPMKVVRENKHLLSVEIIGNAPALQAMHDKLKAFNAQTTKQYQEASGAGPGPGGGAQPAMVPTLSEQLIGGSRLSQNTWQFHLPMSRDALQAFNQAAVQHLQFDKKVELVKSRSKDWNQDLKEEQMQQAVARELPQRGSVDEGLVSQSLSAAATTSKATVSEPAQETAAGQKHPAGPQIQPSDSPAHDKARLSFITAAAPLVKQLREVNSDESKLAAQQLVDVSKLLLKQPELRNTDKENLDKALVVVDKYPAIKETPAVQQLREAADLVSKPVGTAELKQSAEAKQAPAPEEPPTEERPRRGMKR